MVEFQPSKLTVAGSSPVRRSKTMLGRKKKKKTGTQIAQEIGTIIAVNVENIGKRNFFFNVIFCICIVIFSFSISFGIYGWVSRLGDISKKEQSVENLQAEMELLKKKIKENQELKIKLASDPFTIESLARSYGMSKKGERTFYFVD